MTRPLLPKICAALALVTVSCTPAVAPLPRVTLPPPPPAVEAALGTPRILLLGDSQISYGAGGPYRDFLNQLGAHCPGLPDRFAKAETMAVGVRSTALHHWTSTEDAERDTICAVDPTFGVNAGSYGMSSDDLSFVQIGSPDYPYCPPNRSPLAAAVSHHKPDLVLLAFLGNATQRWQDPAQARADWRAAQAALPPDVPCAMMTTIPAYEPAENQRRRTAQTALAKAVRSTGRCSFIPGLTHASRQAIEGDPANFRTNDAGEVTDATHPTAASAARYVAANRNALCAGLRAALTE